MSNYQIAIDGGARGEFPGEMTPVNDKARTVLDMLIRNKWVDPNTSGYDENKILDSLRAEYE